MDGFVGKYKNAIEAFNFDDFILLPGLARMEPKDINLTARFSKNIKLNIPLVSAPMDTVTEAEMAIALAKKGGIGVIHRNCSAEEEVEMAKRVKMADPSKETNFSERYKDALLDKNGRLMVAAAISPFDLERAKKLSKYVDALLIDVAHFHNLNVIAATKTIIKETGSEMIIGSFGTKEGVIDCVSRIEEAAGLRVGIGGGSICTTTDVTRAGSPALFATAQAADALQEMGSDIPIISDGGIRTSGDIALAAAFGASSAMLGYVLAGCMESPSDIKTVENREYKLHRGMGSRAAREKRAALDRYANLGGKSLEEGVQMLIPYTGKIDDVVDTLTSGIRAAIGYAGALDMADMRNSARVAKIDTRSLKITKKMDDRRALSH